MKEAEHEETAPAAPTLLVSKLTFSLAGKSQTIKILPNSLLHQAYGCDEATEQFACSYGLNPQFRYKIEKGGLKVTGTDLDGEVRVVELSDHPFYVATLFVPQVSSQPANPHPLIFAFLKAAISFQSEKGR
jgi:CTP synthase (UTP-ammonia lyase)